MQEVVVSAFIINANHSHLQAKFSIYHIVFRH